MEEEVDVSQKRRGLPKIVIIAIIAAIALAGYGGTYYYYNRYKQTKIVLDNPEVASINEIKDVTEKLGKIYDLPKDEEPTVATVLDKEKLKDQPFFARAENGDKVVIFTKSQLAILFRVSENKIITVAPVSLQEPKPSPEATLSEL
ncbi:MAG: hypothetical protein AAB535_01490 [Patescibacteria group bacterium]